MPSRTTKLIIDYLNVKKIRIKRIHKFKSVAETAGFHIYMLMRSAPSYKLPEELRMRSSRGCVLKDYLVRRSCHVSTHLVDRSVRNSKMISVVL